MKELLRKAKAPAEKELEGMGTRERRPEESGDDEKVELMTEIST